MKKRIRQYFSGLTIRTKYVTVFMGAAAVSYLAIILIVSLQIGKYEERKAESTITLAMEQAVSYIQSEVGNTIYASDVLYQDSNVYDILENSYLQEEQDLGEEYRKWYQVSQVIHVLKKENIFNIRIYAPDNYLYTEQNKEFVAISTLTEEPIWQELLRSGEKTVWAPDRIITEGNSEKKVHSLLRRIVFRSDYSKTIGVVEVNIETERLQDILEKANVSEKGCVFLTDLNNQRIEIASHMEKEPDWNAFSQILSDQQEINWENIKIGQETYIFQTRDIQVANWRIVTVIPLSELTGQVWSMRNFLMVLIVPIMLFFSWVIYSFANSFSDRILTLCNEMEKVCEGDFSSDLDWDSGDELGKLYSVYRYMLAEVDKLLKKQYEDGKAIKNAEIKALQAQINPHFLYNTLELIRWEAMENDAVEISDQVQTLARYYRAVLSGGADIVSLGHEIDQIYMYIQIQNYRFDGRIDCQCEISEELQEARIIKLILQPLVENSILHGFAYNDISQYLSIRICAYLEGGKMVITVKDDGTGMSQEECSRILLGDSEDRKAHYAVSNIHNRLQLNYGEEYGLRYESRKGDGTVVYITVPYLQ